MLKDNENMNTKGTMLNNAYIRVLSLLKLAPVTSTGYHDHRLNSVYG